MIERRKKKPVNSCAACSVCVCLRQANHDTNWRRELSATASVHITQLRFYLTTLVQIFCLKQTSQCILRQPVLPNTADCHLCWKGEQTNPRVLKFARQRTLWQNHCIILVIIQSNLHIDSKCHQMCKSSCHIFPLPFIFFVLLVLQRVINETISQLETILTLKRNQSFCFTAFSTGKAVNSTQ